MVSTLIVIVFPDEARAENVFQALGAMRRRELYNLEETLLTSHAPTGDVVIRNIGPGDGGAKRNTVEAIARLILGQVNSEDDASVAKAAALQQVGIDHHFIAAVARAMAGEFSALFFLIHADTIGDATELTNVLSLFRGQIARTTLTPQAQAYLATN
jgi:uncharacterized membrane protein